MDDSIRLTALAGLIAAAIALTSWIADHRRQRRSDIDRVGFMPWTAIFFLSFMAAVLLMGLALREWLST